MKLLSLTLLLAFSFVILKADEGKSIPEAKLKNLKGEEIHSSKLSNDGKPMVINFWATWCKPCLQELDNIAPMYEEWQKLTGVKIVAISLDDSRSSKKVAPFVKGRDWSYEVYLDENQDFKRALNVTNPPQTFLVDKNGKIVWSHNGYAPGDENELFEQIKKLSNK